MFSEKTKLIRRENPFYGSYGEGSSNNSKMEALYLENRRKRKQLTIVTVTVSVLIILTICIVLGITLPKIMANSQDPPDPKKFPPPSNSAFGRYSSGSAAGEGPFCSRIGRDILQTQKGNAVDAAIAMAFCHGVTAPQSSGIGGGFFMIAFVNNTIYALNSRERAPNATNPKYYNDPEARERGGLSVGIPTEVAGLWAAHSKFGSLPWKDLVRPSRELAEKGFKIGKQLAKALNQNSDVIKADPGLRSEFINPKNGQVFIEGELLIRPKLGATLLLIENEGGSVFYNGSLTDKIVSEVVGKGSVLTKDDLNQYKPNWVEPVSYKLENNLTVFGLPFPSSSSLAMMAIGILEGYGKIPKSLVGSKFTTLATAEHRIAEALKFAYGHRGGVADPSFANISDLSQKVLDKEYVIELRNRIVDTKTFYEKDHYGPHFGVDGRESGTAQICVIGPNGDTVSLTTTINYAFGAGFMGENTGIIYNNELADFSFPNLKNSSNQTVPNKNNYIHSGKCPASSMSPLIFLNETNHAVLVSGGAGGSQILGAVILANYRTLYQNIDIKEAIDYPRYMPTNVRDIVYEFGLPTQIAMELERRGHGMERKRLGHYIGNVVSIGRTKMTGTIVANSDFRKHGNSSGY